MFCHPDCEIGELVSEAKGAKVYRGYRKNDGLPIILKSCAVYYPDHRNINALKHEYEILCHLDGTGAPRAYSLKKIGQRLVLVMEDFEGISVAALTNGGKLPLDTFLTTGIAAADALGRIHAKGILVGDISADSIHHASRTGRTVYSDFTLAGRMVQGAAPVVRSLPDVRLDHSAPELFGRLPHAPDWRTDLYALGVTFYGLLTGRFPFEADDPLKLLHSLMSSVPMPPSVHDTGIPEAVSNIILKLLAKSPEDRYQSAFGLKIDLEHCQRRLTLSGKIEAFRLGSEDHCDFFRLSERLYGRDKERQALSGAVERLIAGGRELVLVSGYAGIGKTSLIAELRRPIITKGGHCVSGKFEALRRNEPFSALVGALGELVSDFLAEPAIIIEALRERLDTALQGLGQVLVDLLPELEAIIGPQPPIPNVSPREAQARLTTVFLNFLKAICRPEHPVAVVLDDLHWADAATLNLLESVLTDAGLNHFLCLGTYRDNEVDAGHLLSMSLNALRACGVETTPILLGPIGREATRAFLADSFRAESARIRELADILHCQTWGNPFYLRQALTYLHADGLITYALPQRSWLWDADTIAARDMAENAADLLARRVVQLPQATMEALRLAACLGNAFDLTSLALLRGGSSTDAFAALTPALQAGLLYTLPTAPLPGSWQSAVEREGNRLSFSHDRVREAAASLWEGTELCAAHRRIASMLLANLDQTGQEVRVFEITDHFNRSLPLIEAPAERRLVSEWNLRASRKARLATAFAAALGYARQAMDLLPLGSWSSDYDLTRAICKECGLLEHLNHNFEAAEACYNVGIENAVSLQDRCDFVNMRINQWSMNGKVRDAVEEARRELALYGIRIEENEVEASVKQEVGKIFTIMAGRRPAAFIDMPVLTDPLLAAASTIIDAIAPSTYFYDRKLLALLGAIIVRVSLEQGYTRGTYPALGSHGRLLVMVLGDAQLGYEFGQLGLDLCRKHNATPALAVVISTFVDTAFYFENSRTIYALLKEGIHAAFLSGDLYHVELLRAMHFLFQFFYGNNLKQTLLEIGDAYPSKERIISLMGYCLAMAYSYGINSLVVSKEDENFLDEQAIVELARRGGQLPSLAYLHGLKAISYFILGDKARMQEHFVKARELGSEHELFLGCDTTFYRSLAWLSAPDAWPTKDKAAQDQEVEESRLKLQALSRTCPESFQARHLLLEAEAARVHGRPMEDILDLYDGAITAAEANGLTHIAALSEELAGKFWLSRGKPDFACSHLAKAVQGYRAWGADRKARDLEAGHKALFARAEQAHWRFAEKENTSIFTPADLDLRSLMKAAGAISSEIVLSRLAATLTHLIAENAGAQTCRLALCRDADLCILTGLAATPSLEEPSEEIPLDAYPDIPASILRLTAEKRSPILLEDASSEVRFAADPYIARAQPRSILCAPIIRQDKLLGVIYLENNLMRGAFTRERLEIVGLLAAQAAISLENATLYAELHQAEAKYREVFDNALEGIFRISAEGRILFANPAAARILGYASPEQAMNEIGDVHAQVYADPAQLGALLDTLRQGIAAIGQEVLLCRRDGGHIWALVNARPILDAAGQITAVEGLFADITQRKEAETKIRQLNTELVRIQEREWSRISMNLHDDVAQNLLAAKILAGRLLVGHPGLEASGAMQDRLAELKTIIGESIATVRDLSVALRPPNLERLGLADALRTLCEDASEKSGLEVECSAGGLDEFKLEYETQVNLFRLAQEALNNILKHAKAQRVSVRVTAFSPTICLRIEDDGRGFDLDASRGEAFHNKRLGLSTMRERAELIGGRLDIVSRPGLGTRITLEFKHDGGRHG